MLWCYITVSNNSIGWMWLDLNDMWHNSLQTSNQMATDNAIWAGRRFNGPPVGD